MTTTEDVNRWVEPAWAQRYLRERANIPHRAEGVGVLVELMPAGPLRVLDLGTGAPARRPSRSRSW